jgi:UDP-N-acetylmuramate: L-alanyl-gamma-D-glutamyl-meso-diaminopimelate ligase
MPEPIDYSKDTLRNFTRPSFPNPARVKSVYFIGICGTGMGALAALFKRAGYEVRGSDENVYPPMSTKLAEWGIEALKGYDPAHLEAPPDLIITGNTCTPKHPEAAYAREHNLVQMSFPEALGHFFLADKHCLVVAGTHGKSTTTALMAHTLEAAGLDPSFLVGAVMQNGERSFNLGQGNFFVVEGDEYDSAYFDKRPKFVHYRPRTVILTAIEYDHADIYADFSIYRRQFATLISIIRPDGLLVACADDPVVAELIQYAPCRVATYGIKAEAQYRAEEIFFDKKGANFLLADAGGGQVKYSKLKLPLWGTHNVQNALGVAVAALALGLKAEDLNRCWSSFLGLQRRQQLVCEYGDIAVVDDFAHHPTAVRETIRAVRSRFPTSPLRAVFEPRSNTSKTKIFQKEYAASFAGAVKVYLAGVTDERVSPENRFSPAELVADLQANQISAEAFSGAEEIKKALLSEARKGDVILVMSNGGFGGLVSKLSSDLKERNSKKNTTGGA